MLFTINVLSCGSVYTFELRKRATPNIVVLHCVKIIIAIIINFSGSFIKPTPERDENRTKHLRR